LLHFAAKSLVSESMKEPAKYWHGNVVVDMSRPPADALVRHGTRAGSSLSTAAPTGEPTEVPIKKPRKTRPTNTYGRHERASD